jgi:hypothetical protein
MPKRSSGALFVSEFDRMIRRSGNVARDVFYMNIRFVIGIGSQVCALAQTTGYAATPSAQGDEAGALADQSSVA